ncbi:MAG: bifunctional 3,4-dihydroxy-2-butanone-4-phosphate synthase/GTP cyclohydrolase II [Candidatus Peribacteraceae bacterium]
MQNSNSVGHAIEALKKGEFVIVVDDEGRENEGDLVLAAEAATAEKLAFMIQHTGGVICLALSNEIAERLKLPPMVEKNTSKRTTAFTVSIEAREGIDTGISAADRARTILTAIDPECRPEDLSRPGHVFPLRASDGGVLVRAGHTEASVDLVRLAGLREGAVISELMHKDGTMMRLPELKKFATEHSIPLITVAELIAYRRMHETMITLEARTDLETEYGTFEFSVYTDAIQKKEHVALRMGAIDAKTPTLVRVHSECITGDVFHSRHCDCGEQLDVALEKIAEEGAGVLLYLRQEGRGIGLINKIKAYNCQSKGADTVDANRALGLPDDLREYGIGAQILKDIGVGKIRLLTNNPKKIAGIEGHGLEVVEQVPISVTPKGEKQEKYLKTKKERMGHRL